IKQNPQLISFGLSTIHPDLAQPNAILPPTNQQKIISIPAPTRPLLYTAQTATTLQSHQPSLQKTSGLSLETAARLHERAHSSSPSCTITHMAAAPKKPDKSSEQHVPGWGMQYRDALSSGEMRDLVHNFCKYGTIPAVPEERARLIRW